MHTKQIARMLIIVLAALALTALVAAAQDAPSAPAALINESEPNNTFATADSIDIYNSEIMAGKINPAGDVDYFHIVPDEEELRLEWLIDIDAVNEGSALDAVICVYNHNQVEIACNDDSEGHDSLLFVSLWDYWPADFYIKVYEYNHPNEGGNNYTYQLSVYQPGFLSAATGGTVDGTAFQAADILAYNSLKDRWFLFFDASDFGTLTNIGSMEIRPEGAALTFQKNQVITDENGRQYTATPYDVVQFNAYRWGADTAGFFSPQLLLDGSAVGLSASSEKIDAIGRWWPDGNLTISTTGAAAVPAATGGTLKGRDEDLLEFDPAIGKWRLDFDGSMVPGLGVEDVFAAYEDLFHYDIVIQGSGVVAGNRLTQKDILMVEWGYGTAIKGLHFDYIIDAVSY